MLSRLTSGILEHREAETAKNLLLWNLRIKLITDTILN